MSLSLMRSCVHEELIEAEHDLEMALLAAEHKQRRIALLRTRLAEIDDNDERSISLQAEPRVIPSCEIASSFHSNFQHADFPLYAAAPAWH